ncbi:MAG: O-antigen ligase family protein [Rubrivivax sp.]|nr:O-antigen ligase family protein [Rubrivivax sp.]
MDAQTQDILTVVTGAGLIVAVTAACVWLVLRSTANKIAPLALLLFGFCLEVYFFKQPYIQLGLQVYPNDLISLFVLLSAMLGFAHRPVPVNDSPFLLWLGFGMTITASLVVGLNEYGRYAGTEVRPFFYMWVAGLYCCVTEFSKEELRRVARWCVWSCYVLIGIAIYYYIAVEVGFVNRQALFEEPDTAVFRPVGAAGAFLVAIVALVQTMAWLRGTGTRYSGTHAAVLIAFTVVMQHRSVWIAAAVGLLCIFILERRHLPRRFALLLGFVMVGTLAVSVAGAFGLLDDLTRRLMQSTLSMTDSGGTFAARVDGWIRLLDNWTSGSFFELLFGFPFGQGYTRMYNGVIIEFAPHNFFLDLVLRVGLVGAILFILPTGMAMVHGLWGKADSEFEYLMLRGLGVCLLAAFIYFIAYPSYYLIGAATGISLSHFIRQRRVRADVRRPLDPVRSPLTGQIIGWRTER